MRRAAVATILIAFLAMGLGVGAAVSALHKERAAHEATKAQHAHERAAAAASALANERRNRELEQELTNATEAHANTQAALDAARRAAVDRARSDGRLRDQSRAYAAAAGAQCANPTAAANQPTAADALDLLAGLLDRADERARELAAIADDARARGLACEADYDRARAALSKD